MAKKQNTVKRMKSEGATTGEKYSLRPPSFYEDNRNWDEAYSYTWPPTLVFTTCTVTGDMLRLLDMDIAEKGFQEVQYTHHAPARKYSWTTGIFVFPPTARGFAAVWSLSQMPNYKFATMRHVNDGYDGKWIPIVSDIENDMSPEIFRRPEQEDYVVKDVEQKFTDIQLLALSPLQRTQLQDRMLVLRDNAFSSGFKHELQPNELHSELEELMKEAAECNQKDVEELLQDSFQRHSMLKILFTLNGAKTTQHLLTRIEQLMTYLSDSNKTADGGDHLISRVIDKGMEMELKTLDLLGKSVEENNSVEDMLRRKDLDIVNNMKAFITKQREDFMKHLQELVADKEESLGELLPSRLELLTNIRSQPDVRNMTNFFSTSLGKIVQEVHKNTLVEATTKPECVICLGELGGPLDPPAVFETTPLSQRKRGCFLPCIHASVCILCCVKIWETGPQVCPLCQTSLTERPKPLYL